MQDFKSDQFARSDMCRKLGFKCMVVVAVTGGVVEFGSTLHLQEDIAIVKSIKRTFK